MDWLSNKISERDKMAPTVPLALVLNVFRNSGFDFVDTLIFRKPFTNLNRWEGLVGHRPSEWESVMWCFKDGLRNLPPFHVYRWRPFCRSHAGQCKILFPRISCSMSKVMNDDRKEQAFEP